MMKIKGLKKAVGDYREYNGGGKYSTRYGILMYNKSTGELWTDEFYDFSHRSYIQYNDESIMCLCKAMADSGLEVTMKNIKRYIEEML